MSKNEIPADIKQKMYDNIVRAKLSLAEYEQMHDEVLKKAHEGKEYKQYMKAIKRATRKYDGKISELKEKAEPLIDATDMMEQAASFKHRAKAFRSDDDEKFFAEQELKYQRIIDEAKSAGGQQYSAFKEYNELVARKESEIADKKAAYEEIVNEPYGYKHQQTYKNAIEELEASKQRLKDNPDDRYARMQVQIAQSQITTMDNSRFSDRYDSSSWFDYMAGTRNARYLEQQLKDDGYSDDDIRKAHDDVNTVASAIVDNVRCGSLPADAMKRPIKQYETSAGDTAFAIYVSNRHCDAPVTVNTAWGDTYTAEDGDYIVSDSPAFTDAIVEKSWQFSRKYSETNDASAFDNALHKAANAPSPATSTTATRNNQSKSFIDSIIDSITNRNDSGASDMDGRSERDKKTDDSQYETFKDKDGNTCRRSKTTGETTVWVEGYDRMRNGKSEHVKSYWKVIHPRG